MLTDVKVIQVLKKGGGGEDPMIRPWSWLSKCLNLPGTLTGGFIAIISLDESISTMKVKNE